MANYKYSGSALGASYLPNIKSPLDVRTVVNDKHDYIIRGICWNAGV